MPDPCAHTDMSTCIDTICATVCVLALRLHMLSTRCYLEEWTYSIIFDCRFSGCLVLWARNSSSAPHLLEVCLAIFLEGGHVQKSLLHTLIYHRTGINCVVKLLRFRVLEMNCVFNNYDIAAMAQLVISDKWIAFLIFVRFNAFAIIRLLQLKLGPTVYIHVQCTITMIFNALW